MINHEHFGEEIIQRTLLSPTIRWRQNSTNFSILVCLLLCGDVHANPGPNNTYDENGRNIDDTTTEDHSDAFQFDCFNKRGIHIIHSNVRSLLPSIDELRHFVSVNKPHIIGISETWLDDSILDSEISLAGYKVERKDRNRSGGGVATYISNTITSNRRSDIEDNNIEMVCIDILLPKSKPILVCNAYRPPKDESFYENLDHSFENCESLDQEIYIIGDLNTDISHQDTSIFKKLKSFLYSFHMVQIISEFTRVTPSTSSTLDLIIVSDQDKVSQSGVLTYAFSDHQVIYCTRKQKKICSNCQYVKNIRCMRNYDVSVFKEQLRNVNWFNVLNSEDIDKAWLEFKKLFLDVLNIIAPVKSVRVKQKSEAWFNGEILHLLGERNRAFVKFRKSKLDADYVMYKGLRNRCKNLIESCKKGFIKEKIESNSNNAKDLWKTLKNMGLTMKGNSESSKIGLKDDRGDIVFDESFVTNKFNNFFCNVASKLVSLLPNSSGYYISTSLDSFYIKLGVQNNSFKLSIVSDDDVDKLLTKLNVTKSTGHDDIPARFLKDGHDVLSTPLAYIFNLSVRKGLFPNDLKKARVVPLYKKGNRNIESNYRPISILPVVSKIYEKLVHDQVMAYLESKKILYDYQSGFRNSFSTESALVYLTDKIKANMDKGLFSGLVLMDLQKAFDTVDHNILVKKLKCIGFNSTCIDWFTSYLSNRTQFVDIQGHKSECSNISCGVPQGSILGPMLFLIYVNDMSSSVQCDLYLYADDSALVISGRTVEAVESRLAKELKNVSNWLVDNRLSLHLGKTESIIYGTKQKLSRPMNIIINDVNISAKDCVKYLGAYLDQCVSGVQMAEKVVKRVNQTLKFLYRKGQMLTFKDRLLLCNAMIQPFFDYGCCFWYNGLCNKYKNKLQTCQNKVVRFIFSKCNRSHVGAKELCSLKWLNVEKRVELRIACNMFKVFNGKAPNYLNQLFTFHNKSHNTRYSSMSFSIPHVNSNGKKSFFYSGIILWNNLPNNVKKCKSYDAFKSMCKSHFSDQMINLDSDDFIFY